MLFAKQIEKIYRSRLYARADDAGTACYFGPEDFPELKSMGYTFPANAGHTLQGYFYRYDNAIPGRLVVFDHGMGGGHRSYMREIERLARAGYLVFAYDHTGCMESGGEHTNGFAQSLNDLDACLKALKKTPGVQGRAIAVVGHSWGGFAAMNIPAVHPDVSHVVAISGFVSVKTMVDQNFQGILKLYRKHLYALERRSNPDYVDYHAVKSLRKTSAKVLLIHCAEDPMVRREGNYDVLKQGLDGMPNVRFLLETGKGHNPNYTADAVRYLGEYTAELTRKLKHLELGDAQSRQEFVAGYDWKRMTEQDETVWKAILDTLKA